MVAKLVRRTQLQIQEACQSRALDSFSVAAEGADRVRGKGLFSSRTD